MYLTTVNATMSLTQHNPMTQTESNDEKNKHNYLAWITNFILKIPDFGRILE